MMSACLIQRLRQGLAILGASAAAVVTGLVGIAGCGSDKAALTSVVQDDSTLYWKLEVNHWAATMSLMSPYNTLALQAVPRTVHGDVLPNTAGVQYESRDVERVRVSPEGVINAIAVTDPIRPVTVLARLRVGNLTHVDSVMVQVIDIPNPPPVLGSLSIHPIPPDSAKMAFGGPTNGFPINLPVRATDTGGVAITGFLTAIRSSDPQLGIYTPPLRQYFSGLLPGDLKFYASATVFGITKVDTVPYRIGLPVLQEITVKRVPSALGSDTATFSPQELRVGVGAMVYWFSSEFSGFDLTFAEADLPHIAAANTFAPMASSLTLRSPGAWATQICSIVDCSLTGNITMEFKPDLSQAYGARVFPMPGTYEYQSMALGIRGRIVVVPE